MTGSVAEGDDTVEWVAAHLEPAEWMFQRRFGCTTAHARSWALRVAYRLANRNLADAEDLVQDTLMKLTAAKPLARPIRNPRSYVLSTLMSCWHDKWRADNAEIRGGGVRDLSLDDPIVLVDPPARFPGPEKQTLARESRQRFRAACVGLAPKQLEVVSLALDPMKGDFNLRSRQEIADIMGIPVGTVKRLLHEAIKHIRENLDPTETNGKVRDE